MGTTLIRPIDGIVVASVAAIVSAGDAHREPEPAPVSDLERG